jgi:hypothetical protein
MGGWIAGLYSAVPLRINVFLETILAKGYNQDASTMEYFCGFDWLLYFAITHSKNPSDTHCVYCV